MISPTFTPSILCDHLSAKMALWSQVYVWLIKQRGSKANTDHLTLIFTTRYPSVSLPVDLNSFLQTHLTYPTNSPPPQPPPLPLPTRWHCSTGCLHFFFLSGHKGKLHWLYVHVPAKTTRCFHNFRHEWFCMLKPRWLICVPCAWQVLLFVKLDHVCAC